MRKLIRIIAAALAAVFCFQTVAFASSGDPNIDHGGSGLESGKAGNFWYSGDEGVRETLIKNIFEVKFKDFQNFVIFLEILQKTGRFSIKKPPVFYYLLPIFRKRA